VEDFIAAFEHLYFRTEGMSDAFFRECFIIGLKDEICAHVLMAHPQTWLEVTQCAKEAQQLVSSQTRKSSFPHRPKTTNFSPPATPLKIQKLTRAEMVELQLKVLCYNCDDKYFTRHKCKKQNGFMVVTKDLSEEYVVLLPLEELPPPSDLTPPSEPPDVDPMISLNSLTGFSTSQSLKLIGYIKK